MKVKVIKSFRDKFTREAIREGREIEITEERFSELTAGPFVFVEEIQEEVQETPPVEKEENETDTEEKEQPPTDEEPSNEDKKTTKKSTKK